MLDFLSLPQRSGKPRESGLTHVLDKGLGPAQVDDLMAVAAPFIDIVKLGWGTSYITANLAQKIAVYQSHGIPVCFGGTLLEVVVRQSRMDDYIRQMRELGITHVEVSDGTVAMAEDDKLALLRRLARDFTCSPRSAARTPTSCSPPTSGSTRSSASSTPAPGR